jgi:hypothetical protein
VAWDDPCGVPFAGLDNLLAAYALEKPEAAESEIERLFTSYPSQRTAALRARATLLARQASVVGDLTRLDEIAAELPEGELLLPVLTPLSDEGDCFEMTKPELRNTER